MGPHTLPPWKTRADWPALLHSIIVLCHRVFMAEAASYQVPCSQIDSFSIFPCERTVGRHSSQNRAFAIYTVARPAQVQRLSLKKILMSVHPALIDRMETVGAAERK